MLTLGTGLPRPAEAALVVTVRRATVERGIEGRVHRGTAARLTARENIATTCDDGLLNGGCVGEGENRRWELFFSGVGNVEQRVLR